MSWVHEDHDIVMLTPDEPKPGARFGPHCITCDELMVMFVIPGPEDIRKARESILARPELARFIQDNFR